MEVVTTQMSGNEPQHLPYESRHMSNEPVTTPRRSLRYTSPEPSSALSPRRPSDTTTIANVRPHTNGDQSYSTVNHTSPTISPFLVAHVIQEPGSSNIGALPQINGQNHDRMETDIDSEDSRSDNQSHATADDFVENPRGGLQQNDGETMDTTPRSQIASELQPALDEELASRASAIPLTSIPAQNEDLVRISSSRSSINTDDEMHAQRDAMATITNVNAFAWNLLPRLPSASTAASGITDPLNTLETSQPETEETPPTIPASELVLVPGTIDPSAQGWPVPEPRPNWDGEREEDSQDDESTDEEDFPFWANLKEDTSSPDEEELKVMEGNKTEISALDHKHWERFTFEPLEDPEYIPGDSGRITWTVQGVNGTAEKPNKEREMRSPSVLIGGHYWNIKYYPRGNPNEGTEQLSIYIECSNSPHEERKCKGPVEVIPPSNVREGEEFIHTQSSAGNPPSMIPEVSEPTTGADPEHLSLSSAGEVDHTPLNIPMEQTPVVEAPWEIAAQVSCVIYNPGEPRVNVSQKSTHRYCNENSDWGWTRFHGPWDEIHKRQRFKRQALLRNDTLAFTAYIRTIKDDTKALWWHLPKDQLEWDSLARIGLKRLVHEMSHSSALIAALSAWLYLDPITDRICNLEIPDPNQGSKPRLRPLTDALQRLIQEARGPKDTTSPVQNMFKISLNSIAKIISWYGEDGISSKNDVVATWEIIRRIVSFEASNDSQVADAADFFPEIWALKQSDCQYDDIHTSEGFGLHDFFHNEPCSVQDTVNIGLRTDSKVAHSWQTFLSHQVSSRKGPLILQVELHRQMFSPEARRWKRLTHRVKLDESITIDLPSGEELGYTLYGMVVHSGALESNDYYTVIRPAGPGTTWVKYAGDKDPKGVTRLTTKQACKSHEGKGKHVEGVSAVAYVALYVRTDSISTIFGNHSKQKETAPSLNKPQDVQGEFQLTLQKEDQKRILVQIYQSDIFNDFPSRGIFDPWAARSSRDYNSALVFEFDLDGSQTLAAVENHIFEEFSNANKKERFRLWALDTKPQSSTRGAPRFVPSLRADHRLDQLATKFGGCRFWLQIITWKDFEEMTRSNDTVEEPATTPVADHMEVVGELSASDQLRPDEIMQEPEVHPSADEVMQVQAVFNAAEEVAQEAVQNTEGTLQQQNVRDPSQNEVLSNPVTEVQERQRVPNDSMQERQEPASAEMEVTPVSSSTGVSDDLVSPVNDVSPDEDTVMDEIQEPEIGGTEVLASPSEPSLSWISTNDITPKAHIEWVYIFLKVFDCDLQTLRGVGGFFIKQKEQIGEAIRRLLVLDDNEQFDIFHEKSLTLNAFDGVRYSNTFEEIGSTFYIDGNIFIVQRRPSDSEISNLETEGKCTNIIDFFAWLRHLDDPSLLLDSRLQSYFGGPYTFTAQKYGRPHGPGVLINLAGDSYLGNFVAGSMSGDGTMAYANGDTYTGQWMSNEPNGQGKMVYAKTGNVYTGGFKKRKRHGKGTMQFEVADEEMQMCNICYEEEMDALFYDCGHVTACEECAKQVDICPVCRKSVRAVVKIWRT